MLSIASAFNNQIRDEAVDIQSGSAPVTPPASYTATRKKCKVNVEEDSLRVLGQNVSSKVSDGDFQGTVRLLCSEESVADYSDETFAALQHKYPAPH